MGVKSVNKYYYNTVFAQAFSPCGKYLVAGNNYGELAVFNLENGLAGSDVGTNVNHLKPVLVQGIHPDVAVLSLARTKHFLVSGSSGVVNGWDWRQLLGGKGDKPSWVISLQSNGDTFEKADANALAVDEDGEKLYVGAGDGRVHVCDLESGKVLHQFKGHKDFIHGLDIQGTTCITASEDGSVRIWDTREKAQKHVIYPFKNSELARPHLGKWVGAVALGGDWMVCGGGPAVALWHLRSLSPSNVFNLPDKGIHVAGFYDDKVLIGGTVPYVYQLGYNGAVSAQVPSSSTTTYSVIWQENPITVLSSGGSGSKLDICKNFSYRELTLTFM